MAARFSYSGGASVLAEYPGTADIHRPGVFWVLGGSLTRCVCSTNAYLAITEVMCFAGKL